MDIKSKYNVLKTYNHIYNSNIVITVPHSVPIEIIPNNVERIRTHDLSALLFAKILQEKLSKYIKNITLIISSQSRYQIDDNRNEAYDKKTELWQKLTKPGVITPATILLDTHSFPLNYNKDTIYFLQNDTHKNAIGHILCKKLKAKGINCNVYISAQDMNSIIDKNNSYKTLIEVNENLSYDDLQRLADELCDALISFLVNKYDTKKNI
jgi:hypothetical protein